MDVVMGFGDDTLPREVAEARFARATSDIQTSTPSPVHSTANPDICRPIFQISEKDGTE
jgi:hypothetical protein